jgi:pyruvate,orthophosphate dikinase
MPKVYEQLRDITSRMEKHYRDMQDFEFTIQDGKLYMLQTRNGKRTGLAAVRVAIDMVEGLITKEEAIFRVEPNQLYDFLVPRLDREGREDRSSGHRPAGFARRGRGTDRLHR